MENRLSREEKNQVIIAVYGQQLIHILQPTHKKSFIKAVVTSTWAFPLLITPRIRAEAAIACAIESGIPFGPAQLPTI